MSHHGHCYKCSKTVSWVSQGGGVYKCPNCGWKRNVGKKSQVHHQDPEKLQDSEDKNQKYEMRDN